MVGDYKEHELLVGLVVFQIYKLLLIMNSHKQPFKMDRLTSSYHTHTHTLIIDFIYFHITISMVTIYQTSYPLFYSALSLEVRQPGELAPSSGEI